MPSTYKCTVNNFQPVNGWGEGGEQNKRPGGKAPLVSTSDPPMVEGIY